MATASKRLHVVDSSAWLEYLANGPNAQLFALAIETVDRLVVPTVVITEVLRRLDAQGRRAVVPEVVAHMRQAQLVPLDEPVAVAAAVLGRQHRLPLADSIIYATAQAVGAVVWTQDADFAHLPDVEYRPHRGS